MDKKSTTINLGAKDGGLAFAFMIVLYVFISFFGQVLLSAICDAGSVAYIAVSSLFSLLSMSAVIIYFTAHNALPFRLTFIVNKFHPLSAIIVVMLAAGMFFGLGFINETFAGVFKNWGLSVSALVLPLENFWQFILFSFTLAVLPAVIEEMFFRGLLLTALSKVKTVYAVFTVSLVFALYHCSVAQFVYQLVYGAALTLLAVYAKSIFPGMIVHFLNNFAVICFEYFNLSINLFNPIVISLGLVVLCLSLTVIFLRLKRSQQKEYSAGEMKKFWLPFAVFGAAVCLAIIISNLFVV